MYRNCPETSQITEILQNGSPNNEKIAANRYLEYNRYNRDLQVIESIFISDEQFLKICEERRRVCVANKN